ncbi:uncharacterized protein [Numenius arquata]|uniref:uncharacterized protein n=1 Tax=Numenius arquata TaxID=31919 RepID=UPI003D3060B7
MEAPPAPPAVPPAPCSAARSLQDELTCPVCLEYFNDPVLVAECGHNFCRACVTQCWEDSARRLCCPQCREPVPQRLFRPNRSLGNIVHIVRQLGLPPGPAEPPPGPPAPAPPLPAAAPPGPPGPPRCPRHGEPLRLYCVQDRRPVCVVCHLSREHRTHTVLPAEEAAHAAERDTGWGRGRRRPSSVSGPSSGREPGGRVWNREEESGTGGGAWNQEPGRPNPEPRGQGENPEVESGREPGEGAENLEAEAVTVGGAKNWDQEPVEDESGTGGGAENQRPSQEPGLRTRNRAQEPGG